MFLGKFSVSATMELKNTVSSKIRNQSWKRQTFIAFTVCFCAIVSYSILKTNVFNNVSKRSPFLPMPNDFSLSVSDDNFGQLSVTYSPKEEKLKLKDRVSDSEAIVSLQAALDMKSQGKSDKALKLFQHAVALSPKHPDILTHFGEFIEQTKMDIVKADELYLRALTNYPDHPAALTNRQRTASIVENLDQEMLEKIDQKRDALSAIPDSNSALRRAKKEAYFQHIYHTVGIEGNTMSLLQTRSILETRLAIGGKSIDEHNEIFGLDAAMKYINSTLLNRMRAVTVSDILEIHRRVLGFVDPTEGGYFRRTQVYVGGHVPPGPMLINSLMGQFLLWLNSDDALDMHPVR